MSACASHRHISDTRIRSSAPARLIRCTDRLDEMTSHLLEAMTAASPGERDEELWIAYALAAAAGFDAEAAQRLARDPLPLPAGQQAIRAVAQRANEALRHATEAIVLLRCQVDLAETLAGERCLALLAGAEEPFAEIAAAVEVILRFAEQEDEWLPLF